MSPSPHVMKEMGERHGRKKSGRFGRMRDLEGSEWEVFLEGFQSHHNCTK